MNQSSPDHSADDSIAASSASTSVGASTPTVTPDSPLTASDARTGSPMQPVGETERIGSLDVLRGIALLGILLLNIQSFAMPGSAYVNPSSYGDFTAANYWVWFFTHLLGSQKFVSIFSMLFGAGVILMTTRAEQRSGHSAGVHYRRMMWLIIFGLVHAHVLWYGDILFAYGVCGLIVFLLRKMRPVWLITIAAILVVIPYLLNLGFYGIYHAIPEQGQEQWAEGMAASWAPSDEIIQDELSSYRGGWLEQMSHRAPMAVMFQTFMMLIWLGWFAGGMMLLGMALFKTGVLSAARSNSFYIIMAGICIPIGLALTLSQVYLLEANDYPMFEGMFVYMIPHGIGAIVQSLGYVALVMLLFKAGALGWLQRALADVGRMALTNYLLHTIICTTIFYGHGFGQFGHFSRVEQLITVIIIWIVQLILSPNWLNYFRFGPFEWLWRTLTYWRPQPLRRAQPA